MGVSGGRVGSCVATGYVNLWKLRLGNGQNCPCTEELNDPETFVYSMVGEILNQGENINRISLNAVGVQ